MILLFLVCCLFDPFYIKDMHNIYYLGLSGEHRCPLGYLLTKELLFANIRQILYREDTDTGLFFIVVVIPGQTSGERL